MDICIDFYDNKLEDGTKLTRNFFNDTNRNILEIQLCNQGINWTSIGNDRENLRKHRLVHHSGFRNTPESLTEKYEKENFFKTTQRDIFYQFAEMHTDIPISIQHFQLRKNLKMLSKSEVIYMRTFGIEKLNIITGKRQFLVLFGNEENEDSTKVVNFDFCFREDKLLIVCGKINGSIILYTINQIDINSKSSKKGNAPHSNIFKMRVADVGESQISNHVNFIENNTKLLVCSNDSHIKIYDLESNFKLVKSFKAPGAVNNYTLNHSENILACVGDFETVEVFDYKSTQHLISMKGHFDFGFSSYFRPNSDFTLATGNQDYTCRLWDLRKFNNLSTVNNSPLITTLHGHFEAIGEICFIDENLLLYAENTDFLHLYDLKTNTLQSLEYFGSSSGVCVHPDTKRIYMSIHEYSHFGVIAFDQIRDNKFSLDNYLI